MYFLSAARQFGTVIAANGTCSYYCISHFSKFFIPLLMLSSTEIKCHFLGE